MKCKNCIYFEYLGKNKEAWGVCTWFEHWTESEALEHIPDWSVKISKMCGALNPERKACSVFDGGEMSIVGNPCRG
jgi:hypothetical protein